MMRFLLPFFDDSTLLFAKRLGGNLVRRGHSVTYCLTLETQSRLSTRQMKMLLQEERYVTAESVISYIRRNEFDAVIAAKVMPSIRLALKNPKYRANTARPSFIVFQPGLELTPERGFSLRRLYDAVFLMSTKHAALFRSMYAVKGQHVSYGHPSFSWPAASVNTDTGHIVFFAQAISPATLESRLHILKMLNAMAKRYSHRNVVIKLRHLPDENARHVHREEYPYPVLARDYVDDLAQNLSFFSGTMEEVLSNTGYAITCTSTAAMDSLAAGVPTAVYLDFTEFYLDKLTRPMHNEFAESNIIASLEDILHLRAEQVSKKWMANYFRGDDLYEELEEAVLRKQSALC
ncbi:DUF6716 putative glycosyltransferase [Nitratireductor aquimarinus]|uniref:DUF6716 putative glycosyltransferase n=1 Tax=Nitratireductor aquimarinus TaxID=889300 RepID=UPI0029369354|nr:DUF6716 putative glycosyltransferase [Nitratireductor aquimarinus]MDV2968149.1 DUF6716 putative glycosyltransferase [Nitratireductor aquimarinus]